MLTDNGIDQTYHSFLRNNKPLFRDIVYEESKPLPEETIKIMDKRLESEWYRKVKYEWTNQIIHKQ
jgi:hypothetical protein